MIARSPIKRVSGKSRRERASHVAVRLYADGREVCLRSTAGWTEYLRRLEVMAERQGQRCAICGFQFDGYLGLPTFDHQAGRGLGGAHRDDRVEIDGKWNNAALHRTCNTLKGSKRFEWRNGKYLPLSPAS